MRIRYRSAAVAFLLVATAAFGQDSAEITRLRAANATFDATLSKRDLAALDVLWAQDERVTALHPPSKAVVVGWSAVRKSWESAFTNFPELSVEMKNPQIRIAGNVAIISGVEAIRGKRQNGEIVEFLAPTTNVYEKRGENWLLVHHHAGRAPQ